MVDYEFYADQYGGTAVPAAEWPELSRRAFAELLRYKRIYEVSASAEDAESMAVCAMAEALYSFSLIMNGEGGPVQSLSVGSVSVGYGSTASSSIDVSAKGQAKELYRCASLYLDIYRGVGQC